jgi:hypothetical protein
MLVIEWLVSVLHLAQSLKRPKLQVIDSIRMHLRSDYRFVSLSQAIIVFGISAFLGVKINRSPFAILNVIVIVVLAATLFATVSLIIACIVKTRERFMGVGQATDFLVLRISTMIVVAMAARLWPRLGV